MNNEQGKKELRSRTKKFGGSVIRLFTKLGKHREDLRVLGKQMLRLGTSVGANLAREI